MKNARELTYALHKVVFLLDKLVDQALEEELGITFSQFKIIMAIDYNTVCQKEVATFWDMTEAAVSRQVELLLASKLLLRKENEENRRQYHLTLSEKGKRVFDEGFKVISETYDEYYVLLTETEHRILLESLTKLLNGICKGNDKCE